MRKVFWQNGLALSGNSGPMIAQPIEIMAFPLTHIAVPPLLPQQCRPLPPVLIDPTLVVKYFLHLSIRWPPPTPNQHRNHNTRTNLMAKCMHLPLHYFVHPREWRPKFGAWSITGAGDAEVISEAQTSRKCFQCSGN